jgi:hypothetical protein
VNLINDYECQEGHICFSKDDLNLCGMKICNKSTVILGPINIKVLCKNMNISLVGFALFFSIFGILLTTSFISDYIGGQLGCAQWMAVLAGAPAVVLAGAPAVVLPGGI